MGLEMTFYSVLEGVGMVELCAVVYEPNITCPIEFPFNVSLSTVNGTAGMVSCASQYTGLIMHYMTVCIIHTCIHMHLGCFCDLTQ